MSYGWTMLERLSDAARRAMAQAKTEARRMRHGHVGTEHLVLGILAAGDSSAARVLADAGITLDACRDKVAEAVTSKRAGAEGDGVALTERANRALERAGRLSLRHRAAHVGTVPIMLSVLDVEGIAGQVLRGLSVDLVALRVALEAAGDDPEPVLVAADAADVAESIETPRSAETEPAMRPDATCPACSARLDGALAHCLVTSNGEDGGTRDYVVVYCNACGSAITASPA